MLFQCPGCDREKGERRKKSELFGRTVCPALIGQCVTIPASDWSILATTYLDYWDPHVLTQADFPSLEPDSQDPRWLAQARAARLTGGYSLPTRLEWETAVRRNISWHSTLALLFCWKLWATVLVEHTTYNVLTNNSLYDWDAKRLVSRACMYKIAVCWMNVVIIRTCISL